MARRRVGEQRKKRNVFSLDLKLQRSCVFSQRVACPVSWKLIDSIDLLLVTSSATTACIAVGTLLGLARLIGN